MKDYITVLSTAGADAGQGGSVETHPLVVEGPNISIACTGTPVDLQLKASGGSAPYSWRLVGDHSQFSLSAEDAHATLTGTPTGSGTYVFMVVVIDDDNHEAEGSFTISVNETPSVVMQSVPSVCPNEAYSAALVAEGGDASQYRWSTDLSEQTGLSVAGDRLEGLFAATLAGSTSIDFALSVEAAGCVSAPAPLTLKLESATATACPAIDVSTSLPNTGLPPPCLDNEYESQLIVRRGAPDYQWQALSVPNGLSFDPNDQTISGVARAPGLLTVQVTDGSGRTVQSSYALEPRDKCWFAYVSSESDGSRLHLFDPLLRTRRTLPAAASTAAVSDFSFSPDGRFLAYRLGQPGSAAKLAVVKMATWQEQLFDFGAVTRYAWSDDSSALAVAFDTTTGRFLGGVDVANASDGAPGPLGFPATIAFPTFESTPASVDSQPVWFGGTQLAFLTPLEPTLHFLTTTIRGKGGFLPAMVRGENVFLGPTHLIPGAEGLFSIPEMGTILFYATDGSVPVPHNDGIISPSGRYVARTRDHALRIFRAIDSSDLNDAAPRAEHDGCDTLLAWAKDRERVACTHQTPDMGNELVIFDINPKTDALTRLSDVRGNFLYPNGASVQRRRLFSASGARFAFTTDNSTYVASLDEGTPIAVALPSAIPSINVFSELAFSPHELLLLQHQGTRLRLFKLLDGDDPGWMLSDALPPSARCEEEFRNVEGGWCGVERPEVAFTWSPNSDMAAYKTSAGKLEIYDFRRLGFEYTERISVSEACAQTCVLKRQFGFQP